jgi:uncharacterized protein with HEPN domain
MQRELLYLRDIVAAARALPGFLQGVTLETFLASDLLRSAVMHKLTIIGEAAANLSPELRARYPEVPWRQVVAFRNFVVHAYFSVAGRSCGWPRLAMLPR